MNKKILLISTLVILLFPAICLAFKGKCVKVADGDTITVLTSSKEEIRVRIYGIDTPEKKQAYGQKAKQFTLGLVGGKQVKVDVIDTDRYGRSVGVVYVGKKCLNEQLLKFGYAWLYGQYCKKDFCRKWRGFETRAKINKLGLWGDPHAQAPWDFRRKAKGGTKKSSKIKKNPVSAGAYHGNAGSHTFHQAGCRYYNCKSCTVMFESREEAIKAKFKPCGLCKP